MKECKSIEVPNTSEMQIRQESKLGSLFQSAPTERNRNSGSIQEKPLQCLSE
jgi:hypothetical protein